jgi:hypothetical protein
MAFLNDYKRKAVRRTTEYQVIMEDLVTAGVLDEEVYNKYIGRRGRHGLPETDPDVSEDGEGTEDTPIVLLTNDQVLALNTAKEKLGEDDLKELGELSEREQYDALVRAGLIQ